MEMLYLPGPYYISTQTKSTMSDGTIKYTSPRPLHSNNYSHFKDVQTSWGFFTEERQLI